MILTLFNRTQSAVYLEKKILHSLKLPVFTLWQAVQFDDILFLWWLLLVILLSCTKVWQTFKQRYDDEPSLVIHSFHYSQISQCSMTPNMRFAKYRLSEVCCHSSDILHLLVPDHSDCCPLFPEPHELLSVTSAQYEKGSYYPDTPWLQWIGDTSYYPRQILICNLQLKVTLIQSCNNSLCFLW